MCAVEGYQAWNINISENAQGFTSEINISVFTSELHRIFTSDTNISDIKILDNALLPIQYNSSTTNNPNEEHEQTKSDKTPFQPFSSLSFTAIG